MTFYDDVINHTQPKYQAYEFKSLEKKIFYCIKDMKQLRNVTWQSIEVDLTMHNFPPLINQTADLVWFGFSV